MNRRIIIFICLFSLKPIIYADESVDTDREEVILKVVTTPPHAKIYINRAYYGISPLTTTIAAPGNYTIEAHLHNQQTAAQISITDEKITEVNLKFAPEPLNIAAFIILLVLTTLGIIVFGRVKTKEAKYSSRERMYLKKQ